MPCLRRRFMRIVLGSSVALVLQACMRPHVYPLEVETPAREVAAPPSSITVQSFRSNVPGFGASVAQTISNGIAKAGYIKVVDTSAAAVLSGSLSVAEIRKAPDVTQFAVKGKTYTSYSLRKQASASLTYSLKQGKRTMAGNTFTRQFDATGRGDNPAAAEADVPSDSEIAGRLGFALGEDVVAAVTPHKELRELPLRSGKHEGLKLGMTYMEGKRLDQALGIWKQVIEQAVEPNDKAAAYYNIGTVREAQHRYRSAFQMFSSADQLRPGDKGYIAALTRAENEQKEQVERCRQAPARCVESYRLTIRRQPEDARVRILNSKQRYQDGIGLKPGRYQIAIDRDGYRPDRRWVEIVDDDVTVDVMLETR